MTDNIYAPPKAALTPLYDNTASALFYVVSTRKFLILFFATVGAYQLFWYFKNWNQYRHAAGESLWPAPRALFAIFFTHALLRKIAAHKPEQAVRAWSHGTNAWQLVVMAIAAAVLDSLFQQAVGAPYTKACSLLILIPLAFSYLAVQDQINARCGDPAGKSNDKITGANIAWCVIGAVLWIAAIAGMLA